MPVVLRWNGYVLFFYSNEGNPLEPLHIHVRKAEALAKFWLYPARLADNYGFKAGELREMTQLIDRHSAEIERVWNEYFGKNR